MDTKEKVLKMAIEEINKRPITHRKSTFLHSKDVSKESPAAIYKGLHPYVSISFRQRK